MDVDADADEVVEGDAALALGLRSDVVGDLLVIVDNRALGVAALEY